MIEEIDGSVGAIIHELKNQRLLENTLVIFTSDNGPWLSYGNHGGSGEYCVGESLMFGKVALEFRQLCRGQE